MRRNHETPRGLNHIINVIKPMGKSIMMKGYRDVNKTKDYQHYLSINWDNGTR